MNTCLNCSNGFDGKFCNECGQKASTHRFTLHEWFHEIPHSIFHIDGGFFYTFKNLCLRPGNMIREYLEGRRKSYFSPFLYVLIWCGVFVVISSLLGKTAGEKPAITDFKSAYIYIQTNYYKPLVVAMILPMSLGSWLVFWRSGYYFAEHLVLNTFVIAQMIIGDIILFCIAASPLAEKLSGFAVILNFLLKFPFWIWAYWQFFKPQNRVLGALQILLAIVLGTFFTELMTVGIAYLFFLIKTFGH